MPVILYFQLENHEKGNNQEFAHEESVITQHVGECIEAGKRR